MNVLKFAVRQLLKNPGFTAVAVLTLALGVGANTAIFQLLGAVRMRSLPVVKPHELVEVRVNGGYQGFGVQASRRHSRAAPTLHTVGTVCAKKRVLIRQSPRAARCPARFGHAPEPGPWSKAPVMCVRKAFAGCAKGAELCEGRE